MKNLEYCRVNKGGPDSAMAITLFESNKTWQVNDCPVYVGDFPPRPYLDEDMKVTPTIIPNIWPQDWFPIPEVPKAWASITYVQPSPWRSEFSGAELKLFTDLPGVKAEDVIIEIENITSLKVTATRSDTRERIVRTWTLSSAFDPSTGDALLENGVLIISFQKLPEHKAKRINVRSK